MHNPGQTECTLPPLLHLLYMRPTYATTLAPHEACLMMMMMMMMMMMVMMMMMILMSRQIARFFCSKDLAS